MNLFNDPNDIYKPEDLFAEYKVRRKVATPPGPYGTYIRKRRALNQHGHTVFAETLELFSHRMVKLLRQCYPATYRQAITANVPKCEIEAACQRGLMDAITTWQPTRAKLTTHASQRLRSHVQKAIREHTGQGKGKRRTFVNLDDVGELKWEPDDREAMREVIGQARDVRNKVAEFASKDKYRWVFRLCFVRGFSNEETAEVLGWTVAKVRKRRGELLQTMLGDMSGRMC